MEIEISLYFGIPNAHSRILNVYYTKFITVSYCYIILFWRRLIMLFCLLFLYSCLASLSWVVYYKFKSTIKAQKSKQNENKFAIRGKEGGPSFFFFSEKLTIRLLNNFHRDWHILLQLQIKKLSPEINVQNIFNKNEVYILYQGYDRAEWNIKHVTIFFSRMYVPHTILTNLLSIYTISSINMINILIRCPFFLQIKLLLCLLTYIYLLFLY